MFAPKKILVPTDFSDHSYNALKEAVDIAYQYDAEIYLLHVINSRLFPWTLLGFDNSAYITEIETQSVQEAKEMLKNQIDAYALAKKVKIIPVVKIGYLPEVLLCEQENRAIDFIVIGSSKKFNIIQKLASTLTSTIIRRASFPTLVVSGSIREQGHREISPCLE